MEGTLKTTKQFARVGKSWPSTGFMKTHFLKKNSRENKQKSQCSN